MTQLLCVPYIKYEKTNLRLLNVYNRHIIVAEEPDRLHNRFSKKPEISNFFRQFFVIRQFFVPTILILFHMGLNVNTSKLSGQEFRPLDGVVI